MRHVAPALRLAIVLALAAPLFAASQARAQAPGETIDVGGWKVHSDKNDDGSQTCVAMWQFDDKSMVGFGADTNNLTYLIVSEPEAGLTKNQKVQFKYRVDAGKQKVATGIATSNQMVVVPIADPDADFNAFQAGNTLHVEFGGDTYDEALGGSGDAIKALATCIVGANARK